MQLVGVEEELPPVGDELELPPVAGHVAIPLLLYGYHVAEGHWLKAAFAASMSLCDTPETQDFAHDSPGFHSTIVEPWGQVILPYEEELELPPLAHAEGAETERSEYEIVPAEVLQTFGVSIGQLAHVMVLPVLFTVPDG